jgi:hypothetical protein
MRRSRARRERLLVEQRGLEETWPAPPDRVIYRSSSKSDRSADCSCRNARTSARAAMEVRTQTAAPPVASVADSAAPAPRMPLRRTQAAAEKTAKQALRVERAARAQGLAAALAELPPRRSLPSDFRSPDRTSGTPGSLCRSGYTSLNCLFYGSRYPLLQTGCGGPAKSLLDQRGRRYQRASGSRSSSVASKPIMCASPKPR